MSLRIYRLANKKAIKGASQRGFAQTIILNERAGREGKTTNPKAKLGWTGMESANRMAGDDFKASSLFRISNLAKVDEVLK